MEFYKEDPSYFSADNFCKMLKYIKKKQQLAMTIGFFFFFPLFPSFDH